MTGTTANSIGRLAGRTADQVDQAFDEIADKVGPYDVLFNHAGTIIMKPLHESTEDDLRSTDGHQR